MTDPPTQLLLIPPMLAPAALLVLAGADDAPLPPVCVALGPAEDGLGVKTPPEGTCARHELAAADASWAVLGPGVSAGMSPISRAARDSRFGTRVALPPKSQLESMGLTLKYADMA